MTAAAASSFRLPTVDRSALKSCSQSVELEKLVLAPNQEAMLMVVPVSAKNEPMLGLLNLTGSLSRTDVETDVPLLGENSNANAIIVRPGPTLVSREPVDLTLREPAIGGLVVPIALSSSTAVRCQ